MNRRRTPAEAPITEDRDFIAAALRSSNVPALMMSLIHLTGDTTILRGPIRPGRAVLGGAQGSLSAQAKREIRARALACLEDYRDRGCTLPPPPGPETIHEMMSFVVGETVPDEYVPMMLEELALGGGDARSVRWSAALSAAAKRRLQVLVIGAGMSGLLAAIRLQEAGVPYTLIEKNEGVGGTWYENTYPGCRVDVGNHFYCYSFEPNHDWSEYYSQQPELRDYFDRCASEYGLRPHIRFGTEVVAARFDESICRWEVEVRTRSGTAETLDADVVISAVGQLNRPKLPAIAGLELFGGPAFHSARWEHEHDLRGRRVAVIGTGASALQLVPELADTVGRLVVFQRSPAWVSPNPGYRARVSDGAKWLLKRVPYYARWVRFLIFWPGSDGLLPSLIVDPDWPHPGRSVNASNDGMRELFCRYLAQQVGDDAALLRKVTPDYPPFGKRMLQDDGRWLATLRRDHVTLVTDPIAEITRDAVVCENGDRHPVDAIVFATGFHANRFLWPMQIVGRAGVSLRDLWGDHPRAYLGMTVPGFPNFFCLYGPGTNLAHAGSIIFHSECQVRYIMGCIEALLAHGLSGLECRQEVHDAFNRRLDQALAQTVWSHPGVRSWYKNEQGRVTATSPWRLVDYWRWTARPDLGDYELLR